MKILVTGATGFTGGHLARRLVQDGCRVRTLVREQSDPAPLIDAGIEVVRGDLRDADAVSRAVDGVTHVYHIAAAFRAAGKPDAYYRDINYGGTRNVLDAASRHDIERTVYCSTIGVHGDTGKTPATETSPMRPGDIYQQTKVEAEDYASRMFQDRQPGVIFRPGGIYGPGDTRFLKLFRAIARKRFVMLGRGDVRYQLVYIEDLIDGILLCGNQAAALGSVYILTGSSSISLNEFVGLIADAVGVRPPRLRVPLWPVVALSVACEAVCKPLGLSPPLYPRRTDFFRKERTFCVDKAERELGFSPKVCPRDGIDRTANWYMQQGLIKRPTES
jgi:nucleoside-diphosphate-sugar epimerase